MRGKNAIGVIATALGLSLFVQNARADSFAGVKYDLAVTGLTATFSNWNSKTDTGTLLVSGTNESGTLTNRTDSGNPTWVSYNPIGFSLYGSYYYNAASSTFTFTPYMSTPPLQATFGGYTLTGSETVTEPLTIISSSKSDITIPDFDITLSGGPPLAGLPTYKSYIQLVLSTGGPGFGTGTAANPVSLSNVDADIVFYTPLPRGSYASCAFLTLLGVMGIVNKRRFGFLS